MVALLALTGAEKVAGKIEMGTGMRAHGKGRERVALLAICSCQPLLKVRAITRKSRRATKWHTDVV
jgi:putative component of toxin-antitoxin plasmid stabilization module